MYAFSSWSQAISYETPPMREGPPPPLLERAARTLREAGPLGFARKSIRLLGRKLLRARSPYDVWIEKNEDRRQAAAAALAERDWLARAPVVSLLMPVHRPEARWLERA